MKAGDVEPHARVDSDTVAAWADKGFSEADTLAWLAAAPGRFTPWTARQWAAEGFWAHDAAAWSEASPIRAQPVSDARSAMGRSTTMRRAR